MHPDSVTDWLNKFSKKYDLPHINPHKFRHTQASILIGEGVDIMGRFEVGNRRRGRLWLWFGLWLWLNRHFLLIHNKGQSRVVQRLCVLYDLCGGFG